MTKPDDIPQDIWARLTDIAAKALDKMPGEGPQLRKHRIENIARALFMESEDLLDQIDTLKNIEMPSCAHEFYMLGYDEALNSLKESTNTMDVAGALYLREHPSDASGVWEVMLAAWKKNTPGY